MNEAKIRLSPEEMGLLSNAEWILTKNRILEKGKTMLASIADIQRVVMDNLQPELPTEISKVPAKISRGENYKGLPYLILDQPRYFSKGEVFAIRTMLWWGRMFSITLHLTGNYKINYEKQVAENFELWKSNVFYLCIHEEEWEHHFEENNYLPVASFKAADFSKQLQQRKFIKLAKQVPLDKWDEMDVIALNTFSLIMQGVGYQLPNR